MSSIDYSRPLSEVLYASIRETHRTIRESNEVSHLRSGKLAKEEYARFLMMLWHVYTAIEVALERHANHPVLEPTYNPPLLERAPALSADISYLLGVTDWKSHPIHKTLMETPPAALTNYVNRIHELADSEDPSLLLAHSYVRYLGDLNGGQTTRHAIAKAYNLDSGLGTSFYAFKELSSSKIANHGEMRRIMDWYRAGMNTGAGSNAELKAAIKEEAIHVFDLNRGLFRALEVGEDQPVPITPRSEDKGYSVASVAALIAAVSIAHFALTVAGSHVKADLVEGWVDSAWRTIRAAI